MVTCHVVCRALAFAPFFASVPRDNSSPEFDVIIWRD
jgi:hypothetical protein